MNRRTVRWQRMIVAAAVLAAGCSGTATDTSTSAASTAAPSPGATSTSPATATPAPTTTESTAPPPANEVVVGIDEPLRTLNPFSLEATFSTFSVAGTHMSGAYEIGPDLSLHPVLVVELPSVANGGVVRVDDGLAVTWEVRPDATWSDGTPVTGHDFLFTWEAMTDSFGGAGVPWLGDLPTLVSGVATDETVQLVFAEIDFRYETLFAYVLPRHAVEGTDVGNDWHEAGWPSSGPFVVDGWDRSAGTVRLVRNEAYWRFDDAGLRLPHLDAVEFVVGADGEPAVTLDDFSADVAVVPSPDAGPPSPPPGVEVATVPGRVWEHLAWQHATTDPNQDGITGTLAFRRAVATALDATGIVDASLGLLATPPPPSRPGSYLPAGSDGGWSQYESDAARAGELLEEVCGALGRDCDADPPILQLSVTTNAELRPRIAGEIERQLEAALPLEVEVIGRDSQEFFSETLADGSWDAAVWGWVAGSSRQRTLEFLEIFDPDAALSGDHPYGWGSGGSTADGDAVARYRTRLEEIRRTIDVERFDELASEMVQILADDVVIIPIASRPVTVAWRSTIEGPSGHADPRYLTWNIEEWRRLDS